MVKQHIAWPLGPGSRARIDAVRKIGAEARAWPGHERVVGKTRLFARSAGPERVAASFLFTMSNSAVFFIPAAHFAPGFCFSSVPSTPRGASGAPKGAVFLLSRS